MHLIYLYEIEQRNSFNWDREDVEAERQWG
jgi:hypothetical protein